MIAINKINTSGFQTDARVHVADDVPLDVDLEHGDDGDDGAHC